MGWSVILGNEGTLFGVERGVALEERFDKLLVNNLSQSRSLSWQEVVFR